MRPPWDFVCSWPLRGLFLAVLGSISGCDLGVQRPGGGAVETAADGSSGPRGQVTGGSRALGSGRSYTVVPVVDGGSIRVSVSYEGDAPDPAPIPVTADVGYCGGRVFSRELIVDAGSGGLKNVVVWLVDVAQGKEPPREVSVSNAGCAFEPHVSVTVTGALFKARNEDPIQHTTHPWYERGEFFNWPFSRASVEDPDIFGGKKIERTGLITVRCDVHSWMRAYVWVHENPYIVVTDDVGRASMEEVPVGAYRFVAWHEKLGERQGRLSVKAGEAAELNLSFQPLASSRR